MIEYPTTGSSIPGISLTWLSVDGLVIDFSSGYTFILTIGLDGDPIIEKTDGITGYSDAPNLSVEWGDEEFSELHPGTYDLQIKATRTVDGKDRFFVDEINFAKRPMA